LSYCDVSAEAIISVQLPCSGVLPLRAAVRSRLRARPDDGGYQGKPTMVHAVTMGGLLVGRDAEAGALRGLLRAARAGGAPVALVAGEAGVGKTTLVQHVLTADGSPVLRGQAAEGQPAAYDLLAQVLRAVPS